MEGSIALSVPGETREKVKQAVVKLTHSKGLSDLSESLKGVFFLINIIFFT